MSRHPITLQSWPSPPFPPQSLLPSLRGKAEELVKAWKLPEQQARDLYLALASFMKVRRRPGMLGAVAGVAGAGIGRVHLAAGVLHMPSQTLRVMRACTQASVVADDYFHYKLIYIV